MSDTVLTVLKFCLLALLYLFLIRVVLVVAREMRGTPAPVAPVLPPAPPPPPKPAKGREWRLVVVEPEPERGHTYVIDGEATIGRGGGCAVSLAFDTFVSQVHARTHDREGTLWIEDTGSTNGTIVNGKRIEKPTKLRKGDRVKVGETLLEVDR